MNKKKNSRGFEDMMAPRKNMASPDPSRGFQTKGSSSSGMAVRAKRNIGRNSK